MTPRTAILAISILFTAQLVPIGIAAAKELGSSSYQSSAKSTFRAAPKTNAATCDQSGPTGCDLDIFIDVCAGGGGGLSSEPGGGVTCDVRPDLSGG